MLKVAPTYERQRHQHQPQRVIAARTQSSAPPASDQKPHKPYSITGTHSAVLGKAKVLAPTFIFEISVQFKSSQTKHKLGSSIACPPPPQH